MMRSHCKSFVPIIGEAVQEMVLPVLLQRRSFWCDSRTFPELEVTFATAALAHYIDFGHALIYVGSFIVECRKWI